MLRGDGIDEIAVCVGLDKPFIDIKQDLSGSCSRDLIRVKTIVQVLGKADSKSGIPGRSGSCFLRHHHRCA